MYKFGNSDSKRCAYTYINSEPFFRYLPGNLGHPNRERRCILYLESLSQP